MIPERLVAPIQAENNSERERILNERILGIQLAFLEQKNLEPDKYLEEFKKISDAIGVIGTLYEQQKIKESAGTEEDRVKIKALREWYEEDIGKNIIDMVSLYSGENRISAISSYLRRLKGEYLTGDDENLSFGSIEYVVSEFGSRYSDFGLNEKENVMNIHFEPAYSSDQDITLETIKDWLGKLAVAIVEKYPKVQAVVGDSWLMNRPIMRRFGFTVVPVEEKERMRGNAYWNQLINEDGEINADKVEYLMREGKLPDDRKVGLMTIEDFLKRFLPKDKRGEITLQRVSREQIKFKELVGQEIQREIKDGWQNIISGSRSPNEILASMPNFNKMLDSLGLADETVLFFDEIIKRKISMKELSDNQEIQNKFGLLQKKIDEELRRIEYEEYAVHVD